MTPETLRTLRESRGLTREELAAELKCSASAIVQWEGAKRSIPDWVEEKMLSTVQVQLPLTDLHALLDYARESGESFETFLSTAVREYLAKHRPKPNIITPHKPTATVYEYPSDSGFKIAEEHHKDEGHEGLH